MSLAKEDLCEHSDVADESIAHQNLPNLVPEHTAAILDTEGGNKPDTTLPVIQENPEERKPITSSHTPTTTGDAEATAFDQQDGSIPPPELSVEEKPHATHTRAEEEDLLRTDDKRASTSVSTDEQKHRPPAHCTADQTSQTSSAESASSPVLGPALEMVVVGRDNPDAGGSHKDSASLSITPTELEETVVPHQEDVQTNTAEESLDAALTVDEHQSSPSQSTVIENTPFSRHPSQVSLADSPSNANTPVHRKGHRSKLGKKTRRVFKSVWRGASTLHLRQRSPFPF